MNGLTAAMMGANAYFKENERLADRRKQDERHDWERQRALADLSTLDARARAVRSDAELRDARSRGGLDSLPQEQANARLKREIESGEMGATLLRQPTVEATRDAQANAGLADAQFAAETQPTVQSTKRTRLGIEDATAKVEAQALPEKLRAARAQGAISGSDAGLAVLGRLAYYAKAGDKPGALAFANQVAQIPDLLPGVRGMQFVDVTATPDGQDTAGGTGPGYTFKTSDGRNMFIAHKTLVAAAEHTGKDPKFKFMHDKDTGEVLVGNERTGGVGVARQADPARPRGGTAKVGPLERDVNYLTAVHGMTNEQALLHLNQAKSMTRQQFILRSVASSMQPEKITDADVARLGQLYDSAVGHNPTQPTATTRGASGAPAASGAPSTPDPRWKSLIGVP